MSRQSSWSKKSLMLASAGAFLPAFPCAASAQTVSRPDSNIGSTAGEPAKVVVKRNEFAGKSEVSDLYQPQIVVKHNAFAGKSSPLVICNHNDDKSTVQGCELEIARCRAFLEELRILLRDHGAIDNVVHQKVEAEKRLAEYISTLHFLRDHSSLSPEGAEPSSIGYLFSPSAFSLDYGGNTANYAGDETAVTVVSLT